MPDQGRICVGCGVGNVFHAVLCRDCGRDLGRAGHGAGRVLTWTVIRRAPFALQKRVPYTVAVIEHDDGRRLAAHSPGECPGLAAGERVTVRSVGDEVLPGLLFVRCV